MRRKKMNKKGQGIALIVWPILAFILVIFFVVMIKAGLFLEETIGDPIRSGEFNPVPEGQNATLIYESTAGRLLPSFQSFKWISTAIIMALILSVFISAFIVRRHPIFFVAFLLLWIMAIILSVPLSNAYEDLRLDPDLADAFEGFTASDNIFVKLPVWVAVIGGIGAILSFISIIIGRNQEGLDDVGGRVI